MDRIHLSSVIGAPARAARERTRHFGGLAEPRPRISASRVVNGERQD